MPARAVTQNYKMTLKKLAFQRVILILVMWVSLF